MKRIVLLIAVSTVTTLLSSCFFSPCSGCGHKHHKQQSEPVRSVR